MALFENFPYTDLEQLNLDWIVRQLKKMEDSTVISVNGQTGEVILYEADSMQLPAVDSNVWQIIRTCDGVVCGIHFNKNGNATIVNGNRLIQIYTADNPPPYPVTSVNGQTGDVTLYQGAVVRLPDLTDEQLLNWNIYRLVNGQQRGIQFNTDGSVQIINGQQRNQVYTSANPPAYPVTSVEGMTGAVELFPETEIQFNDIDDPAEHNFKLFSILNSNEIGIKIDDAGHAWIVRGEDEIPVYVQGINDPSDFVNPNNTILELVHNVTQDRQWGIIRSVPDGNDAYDEIGFVVAWDAGDSNYKAYMKVNSTMVQLLTLADIPSTTGVVSINGETGVVTLTGSDVNINGTEATDIDTAVSLLMSNIAVVENGDTATHNILHREFVIWKRHLYQAKAAIAIDDPLSTTNLQAVSKGGLNTLEDVTDYSGDITWGAASVTGASPVGLLEGLGRIRMLRVVFHPTSTTTSGWKTILTIPPEHCPANYISEVCGSTDENPAIKLCRLTTAGVLEIYTTVNKSFSLNMCYFTND